MSEAVLRCLKWRREIDPIEARIKFKAHYNQFLKQKFGDDQMKAEAF